MNPLTPTQVDDLLQKSPAGGTVYLVGIGGCGMSGLAHLLLDLGFRVVGSDIALNEEIRQLRARGAEIFLEHQAEQVRSARPVLLVYTSAVRRDNPELQMAEQLQIPLVRRAVLLAGLLQRGRGVCVAGMHGKTTTSALLAFALEQLGARPNYAIGALVPQLPRQARLLRIESRNSGTQEFRIQDSEFRIQDSGPLIEFEGGASLPLSSPSRTSGNGMCISADAGSGEEGGVSAPHSQAWFVVEADESDGTLCEFQPEHAVILNIDAEHLDYYANLEAIAREFSQFASQTRGHVLFCADDARLAELLSKHPRAVSYGFHPLAAYRIEIERPVAGKRGEVDSLPELIVSHQLSTKNTQPSSIGDGNYPLPPIHSSTIDLGSLSTSNARFTIWHKGERLGEFSTQLLGEKNVSNAAAAIALLHLLGFAPDAIARGIAPFRGAARRQEELFSDTRFRVFDDYGHHPAEIRATLQAFKSFRPRRLLVAFQPHRFTRTKHLLHEFATAFRDADLLWLAEVYAASEPEIPGVNSALLAEAIRAQGQPVEFILSLVELRAAIRAAMQPGDLVLFLGAGADITVVAHALADQLRNEIPAVNETLFAELAARLDPQTVLRRDEPLKKRTTLRVGGSADVYVEPVSEAALSEVVKFCRRQAVPFTLLGRGSNLLIRDGGIRGVVICLAHPDFSRVEVDGERLHCGAGAKLKTVAVEARRQGLAGLEFLEGIPGSVGGAMRMNAGAMGSWMFEAVERIRFMDYDGCVTERAVGEVIVEYRGCPLFKDHIALGAVLKAQRAAPAIIRQRMDTFSQKRWESQPNQPSAGCIFKNPKTISAGRLIDELGLKGTRVGGAMVSDVHANFIVNDGTATARNVLNLIEIIQQRAKATRGIELQTEVEILGEG